MSISMHSASVPIFVRMLSNMLVWLDKAEAHAAARKFDAKNFLSQRLTPDMLPFTAQIQIATDGVKGCLSRLSGTEAPKWPDTEASFDELRARIRKAIEYAQAFREVDGPSRTTSTCRCLEPFFAPDAVYRVVGSTAWDCEVKGRRELLAAIRKFVNEFDRKCTRTIRRRAARRRSETTASASPESPRTRAVTRRSWRSRSSSSRSTATA